MRGKTQWRGRRGGRNFLSPGYYTGVSQPRCGSLYAVYIYLYRRGSTFEKIRLAGRISHLSSNYKRLVKSHVDEIELGRSVDTHTHTHKKKRDYFSRFSSTISLSHFRSFISIEPTATHGAAPRSSREHVIPSLRSLTLCKCHYVRRYIRHFEVYIPLKSRHYSSAFSIYTRLIIVIFNILLS